MFQRSVEFLGFVISDKGIQTCRHIVDAVLDFPEPKTVKEIQRFIRISNFYRSFIKDHSKILSPLIDLTRKWAPFKWTPECQEAMGLIKA